MAIGSDVIRNRLDKKINYGVARTAYDSVKDPGAETVGSPIAQPGNSISLDADLIPASMPTVNTAEVKVHKYNLGKSVGNNPGEVGGIYELTKDTGVTSNRSWLTCATVGTAGTIEKNWLPFGLYGSSYFNLFVIANKGYHLQNIDPSTMTNYEALNYATSNYEFYFDADAGVFVFAGTSGLPGNLNPSTMAVYMISGARYIGRLGLKNYINLDVTSSTPSAGQALVYDAGNAIWEPGTPGSAGSSLEVEDEGSSLSGAVTKINFAGTGVTATEPSSDEILITVPGGASALDDLSDATIASVAGGEILTYNSGTSQWVNSDTIAGDLTVSGDLTVDGTTTTINSATIQVTDSFVFEGATADNYETILSVVDPTADRTVSLPNETGIIVTKDSNTGAIVMPVGTTAQRPGTAVVGMLRFNTDADILKDIMVHLGLDLDTH